MAISKNAEMELQEQDLPLSRNCVVALGGMSRIAFYLDCLMVIFGLECLSRVEEIGFVEQRYLEKMIEIVEYSQRLAVFFPLQNYSQLSIVEFRSDLALNGWNTLPNLAVLHR